MANSKSGFFRINGLISYKEVALMYMPHVSSAEYATKVLTQMIRFNLKLSQKLDETNFRRGSKYLTPRQFKLILHYLGPVELLIDENDDHYNYDVINNHDKNDY